MSEIKWVCFPTRNDKVIPLDRSKQKDLQLGCWPRSYYNSNPRHGAAPQTLVLLVVLPSRMLTITQSNFDVWCVLQCRVLMRYIYLSIVILKWRRLGEVRIETFADTHLGVASGVRC
jgi:hypothetical protein